MAKRKVFLHVGPEALPESLLEHHCPVEDDEESLRAALDIRRTHRQHGYRRSEVEGTWARICRRILKDKTRRPVAISQPLLTDATPDQIDLLVDQLPGCAVHVVLALGATTSPETAQELILRWSRAVKKPDRLHVIEDDAAHLVA